MCYPKGAHSLGHRRGQLLTFWAFSMQLQIFNVLPLGGSFVYSPEGAITHFLGILDSVSNFQCATPRGLIRLLIVGCNYSLLGHFGFGFNFQCATPRGLIRLLTVGCNYSLLGHFGFSLPTPLAGGQEKSFAEQMRFLGLRSGGGQIKTETKMPKK